MTATWVNPYIGIPFVDHGRDRAGLDCWGLVKLVLEREFGCLGLPDFTTQYRHVRDRALHEVFADEIEHWQRVARPEPGDVAVLRFSGRPMHVGLMLGDNVMLTIDRGTLSCVERLDSLRWTGKLEGYYRFQGRRVPNE